MNQNVNLTIFRDSTPIGRYTFGSESSGSREIIASPIVILDVPSSGSHTYKVQAASDNGSTAVAVTYYKLAILQL